MEKTLKIGYIWAKPSAVPTSEVAILNSSPSWARPDSDRPNPRRRKKIGQGTHAKVSPPKVRGGREPKAFCDTRRGLIRRRSDFSSILPLGEQCEYHPIKGGGGEESLSRSRVLRTFASLSNLTHGAFRFAPSFEAWKWLIPPHPSRRLGGAWERSALLSPCKFLLPSLPHFSRLVCCDSNGLACLAMARLKYTARPIGSEDVEPSVEERGQLSEGECDNPGFKGQK